MTPEEQRIAIAEKCGWKPHPEGTVIDHGDIGAFAQCDICNIGFYSHNPCFCEDAGHEWRLLVQQWRKDGQWRGETTLPDYLNDLNAMHEAEETLLHNCPASRWETFDSHLADLCGGFARAHATAQQRAHAFLLTHGITP